MKEYKINADNAGKRLDIFIEKKESFPHFVFVKALKKNKIKVNGKKVSGNYRLNAGDIVTSYIIEKNNNDENKKNHFHFSTVYEDENIIIVDKESGILCNDTTGKEEVTLSAEVNKKLSLENSGKVYPVHRLDFNTSGLVIFAKNINARAILDEAIRERSIRKYYLTVVVGNVKIKYAKLEHQLFKDSKNNKVFIYENPCKGSKTAIMNYNCLKVKNELSLLECELITGRTHQIRGQLAYMGYPLLGDDKYGKKSINKEYGERKQLLCAYKIKINFSKSGHILDYLDGKEFKVNKVPFKNKYFK